MSGKERLGSDAKRQFEGDGRALGVGKLVKQRLAARRGLRPSNFGLRDQHSHFAQRTLVDQQAPSATTARTPPGHHHLAVFR